MKNMIFFFRARLHLHCIYIYIKQQNFDDQEGSDFLLYCPFQKMTCTQAHCAAWFPGFRRLVVCYSDDDDDDAILKQLFLPSFNVYMMYLSVENGHNSQADQILSTVKMYNISE